MVWEVVHIRDYGASVDWRHILKRFGSRDEAVAWARDYRRQHPSAYPPSEIYLINSEKPHERLRLLDILSEQ